MFKKSVEKDDPETLLRRELARLVDPSSTHPHDPDLASESAELDLVRLAAEHRVSSNLRTHFPAVESLRVLWLADSSHENKQREHDLVVLEELEKHLDVIVLKGSISKQLLNPELPRRSSDLDVLVRVEDVDRAGEILTAIGYLPDTTFESWEDYRTQHHHDAPFVKEAAIRHTVEVHRHPLRYPVGLCTPIDRFWDGAVDIELGSRTVRRLGDVDFALNLAVHCFEGEPTALRSVAETAASFQRLSDEQRIELIASTESPILAEALLWSLMLVNLTFRSTIPVATIDELASRSEMSTLRLRTGTRIIRRFGTDLRARHGVVAGMRIFFSGNGLKNATTMAFQEARSAAAKRSRTSG
ncbi:MAG: nucleotidyltransferase family protein [Acidimicrobiales bacterium]